MYKSRSKSDMGRRAWNILRLALLWTRKGGVFAFKKRLMQLQLHLSQHSNKGHLGSLQDGDRQLSFDATPIIHVRMHRPNSMRFHLPHIPCINPQAADAFDSYDFDDQSDYSYYQSRRTFLLTNGEQQEQQEQEADDDDDQEICEKLEEGIDVKAEEFIANFYHQLKLQRQISYLQCNKN